MARQRRSATRWIRIIHRWISMTFVVVAAFLILPVIPPGPAYDAVSTVAIVLLLGLLVTGIWMSIHHYVVKSRAPRRARSAAQPAA
ncbi:hypothetical protein LG299_03725 [Microbacterium lacus]|uniref:hypothetical protein n=1 Tax=Microbacterium lacus TaxID=415217 RepID=UPI00384C2C16